MGEEEKEIEKPNEIIDIFEEIREFNKKNQQGKGLKILTPDQMLSRLPITLVQSKAGDIFLYCLYRSKKLTKQLYKSLVEII